MSYMYRDEYSGIDENRNQENEIVENENQAAETVDTSSTTAQASDIEGTEAPKASSTEYRYSGPFFNDMEEPKTHTYYQAQEPKKKHREPKEKKKGSFGRTLGKCACLALVFGLVAGTAFQGVNYVSQEFLGIGKNNTTVQEVETLTPDTSGSTDTGAYTGYSDISTLVENTMPSIVAINSISVKQIQSFFGVTEQEIPGAGTGIIIGQNDTELLVVTNNHVIEGADQLSVLFSVDDNDTESAVPAYVKGADASVDLAVLSINLSDIPEEILSQVKIAKLGDSSELKVGEPVVAIGNALGYGQSVTNGIVSALNRSVTLQNEDGTTITNELIQTNAAINPGNSGGALLNMQGEVIGINEAKSSAANTEGMGYAIPISDVESIIGDLKDRVTRSKVDENEVGYLGIVGFDVTQQEVEKFDMPQGIYVESVTEGSGAEDAGIKRGDIITGLDKINVTTMTELKDLLQYYKAGEEVEMTVHSSDGSKYVERTVTIRLSTKSEAGIE